MKTSMKKKHRTADERAGVSIAVTWATREQLSPKPVWLVVFNFTKVRPTIAVIVDVVEDAQGHGRRNCLMILAGKPDQMHWENL